MAASEDRLRELMAGQLAIWYAQQLAPDNRSFSISEYLEIHGPADPELLVRAAERRIEEAEGLRLRIRVIDGTPRQYVHDATDYPVAVVDVSAEADPRAAAEEWMRADLARPLELDGGPLSATAVIRVRPDLYFWYQRVHHLAMDGQGGLVLATRGAEIYTALAEGRPLEDGALEPVSVLLDADRAYRDSDDHRADQQYWHEVLRDLPEAVTADESRAQRSQHEPLRFADGIGAEESAGLKAAARRLRTSLPGLLITAAAVYEHRITGKRDVVVGLPVRARSGPREFGIPGMTSNLLPIRLTIGPQTTVADVVRQTSLAVRDGLRHQRYRYEEMRRDLRIVDGSLFGLQINVMSFGYDLRFGEYRATAHNLSTGPVDDIRIDVYDRSGTQINVDVNPDVHDLAAAQDVSRRFLRVLNWLAASEPTALVGRAELLDAGELGRVVSGWNDTGVE
ncbi:condensation domain-containing protein, partial [Streptacidiphilus griseoplanus]|uniref:condensation domain-containing protein n=1 Tax=Peterkaempfera griseoplana TaxID=66896 RepID=UPI000B2FF82B